MFNRSQMLYVPPKWGITIEFPPVICNTKVNHWYISSASCIRRSTMTCFAELVQMAQIGWWVLIPSISTPSGLAVVRESYQEEFEVMEKTGRGYSLGHLMPILWVPNGSSGQRRMQPKCERYKASLNYFDTFAPAPFSPYTPTST